MSNGREQFDLLLTRDKDFTSDYLASFVTAAFGIVLLVIPQQRGSMYATAFSRVWPAEASVLLGKVTRLG